MLVETLKKNFVYVLIILKIYNKKITHVNTLSSQSSQTSTLWEFRIKRIEVLEINRPLVEHKFRGWISTPQDTPKQTQPLKQQMKA